MPRTKTLIRLRECAGRSESSLGTHACFRKSCGLAQIDYITKTYLYNFDPLKPHFYIVKLGFTGYTLFSLFLLNNIDCGYAVEAVLTRIYNLCFEQKYEKYQKFLAENFHFLVVKFSVYLNRHVFVMKMVILKGMALESNEHIPKTENS